MSKNANELKTCAHNDAADSGIENRAPGSQQIADDLGEFDAAGRLLDALLLLMVELPVKAGKAAGE